MDSVIKMGHFIHGEAEKMCHLSLKMARFKRAFFSPFLQYDVKNFIFAMKSLSNIDFQRSSL